MEENTMISPASFIEQAQEKMDQAEETRKEKARLQGDVKQSEKTLAAFEKSVSDAIAAEQRKRKELLAAGYDEKLGICQNRMKECREERAKAKADAVALRIQRENSTLEHENTDLEQKLSQIYEENQISKLFRNHLLVVLFYPQKPEDWLMILGAATILLFIIPLMIHLGCGSSVLLACLIEFIYVFCLGLGYVSMLHKYMVPRRHIHKQAELLKNQIRENEKKMSLTASNIRKSQDETGYHLSMFDDRIEEIEEQMKTIVNNRQEALDGFEQTTREEISRELDSGYDLQRSELRKDMQQKLQELQNKSDELDETEKEIRDVYETRLGKEMMHRQKLAGLNAFCQGNPELPLEQAIDCYRSTKK